MRDCDGCDKTIEEAQAQDKAILTIGPNTYALWGNWHVVNNGVLQPLRFAPTKRNDQEVEDAL